MNDPHTRQTLDALADLYLTGPDEAASANAPAPRSPQPNTEPGQASPHDSAPAPAFLEHDPVPEVAGVIEGDLEINDADTEAELAELAEVAENVVEGFRPRLAPTGQDTPVVEGVLMGNLPGYASPWLSQYAYECSRRYGPAIVVRFIDDTVELEIFDERQATEPVEVVESEGLRLDRAR
ncbi:MAG: hypothetical protein ACYTGQ_11440 [Planctomycetota bacterium]|jgi:hypothetical protein